MKEDPEAAIIVAAVRLYILFSVFDGQPHTWLEYLRTKGSVRQIEEDLPFVLTLEGVRPEGLQELAWAFDILCRMAPRHSW